MRCLDEIRAEAGPNGHICPITERALSRIEERREEIIQRAVERYEEASKHHNAGAIFVLNLFLSWILLGESPPWCGDRPLSSRRGKRPRTPREGAPVRRGRTRSGPAGGEPVSG